MRRSTPCDSAPRTKPSCTALACGFVLATVSGLVAAPHGRAAILFHETFNGYTSFPSENPSGDPVNLGIPQISEGADEFWYGARFEQPDGGSINSDLAVQKYGGSTNPTPVGRVEDDAGMLFHIPAGYENLQFSFDWRTFLAETSDRLVVGYYIGDLGFDTGANRFRDFFNTDFGGNQAAAEAWWASHWVQLLRVSASNSFHHETFSLPDDVPLWIAFWMDNGEGDFAKIDNVVVAGEPVQEIPEPSTLVLAGLGLLGLAVAQGARRARRFYRGVWPGSLFSRKISNG